LKGGKIKEVSDRNVIRKRTVWEENWNYGIQVVVTSLISVRSSDLKSSGPNRREEGGCVEEIE